MKRALLLAVALSFACGDESLQSSGPPTSLRATALLEPPRIRVGELATLEVAVVTPPDHRVTPYRPPQAVRGFWLLDAEALPTLRSGNGLIHRTRIRIRARDVGGFVWPAGQIEVERPDGSAERVALAALPIEVVSVLPEFPDRLIPFGVRPLPEVLKPRSILAPAAAGALAALACVGLVTLARRRRARRVPAPGVRAHGEAPWNAARRALARAERIAVDDPRSAAGRGALVLREFMAGRFGADAVARTTEELAEAKPPFGAKSRWPAFVALLRRFDAIHFRPASGESREEAEARVRPALDEARAFVEEARPPEALQ